MDQQDRSPAPAQGGFDFNHPTIIAILYLGGFATGVSMLVGIVLAYVWKGEPHDAWQDSHYIYLINTFWIGLAGIIAGAILLIVLIGVFVWLAVSVLVVVRSVLCIVNAQKREPMPNPGSWLI